FESGLSTFPAIIIHHDVGTLAEARERLVRRRRSIDPKLYGIGIWQEMSIEELRIFRIKLAVFLLKLSVFRSVSLRGIALPQHITGAHPRPHPVEGREAVIGKPGFVPQEN